MTWRTKDGREIPIERLEDGHLKRLLKMLKLWPRMPRRKLLIAECARRGLPHLGYPHL